MNCIKISFLGAQSSELKHQIEIPNKNKNSHTLNLKKIIVIVKRCCFKINNNVLFTKQRLIKSYKSHI